MRKELKKIVKAACTRGWKISRANSGHIHFHWRTGKLIVAAVSPSCHHAFKNLQKDLARVERGVW